MSHGYPPQLSPPEETRTYSRFTEWWGWSKDRIFRHVPTWRGLSRLGQSKVFRSSYFWIAFVPIAAQVLRKINDVDLLIWGHRFQFDLRLPFSWTIFYIASLVFALASFTYQFCCPEIIRLYSSAKDFVEYGHGIRSVYKSIEPILSGPDVRVSNINTIGTTDWARKFCFEFFLGSNDRSKWNNQEWREAETELFAEPEIGHMAEGLRESTTILAYNYVCEVGNYTARLARGFCTLCYAIGFLLLTIIVVQNIFYVFWVYPEPSEFSHWLIGGGK